MTEQLRYITLRGEGEAEYEEKKSKFLGYAAPVASEAEAIAFLAKIKEMHPSATHHVYAYLLRERNATRYSDDREPQGTAGLPVLDVLRKGEIVDAVIVVVRYFGGTLLGTGGLVRAYTRAAVLAAEAAGVGTRARLTLCRLTCSYPDYGKMQAFFEGRGLRVEREEFTDRVTVDIALPSEESDAVCDALFSTLNGRVEIAELDERFDFL